MSSLHLQQLKRALAGRRRSSRPVESPNRPAPPSQRARHAAVFVLFAAPEDDPSIVLIKRSEQVASHKGELGFPGGVREMGDASYLETAHRETEEEIGVARASIELWGELDTIDTSTGYWVRPFTGLLRQGVEVSPAEREVAEVITVPVAVLWDAAALRAISFVDGSEIVTRPAYGYNGRIVWGATARILSQIVRIVGPEAPVVSI